MSRRCGKLGLAFVFLLVGVFSFAALFAWHLAFISDLSLALVVEVQSLRMGLVLSPLQLLPLSAYFLLADWVRAEY